MVLLLSEADPTIAHILAALYFAYQTSDLVEALREEIRDANLDQTPKIKDLIHKKLQMPLLYAVLQESLRLIRTQTAGSIHTVPKDGITIAERHITEGVSLVSSNFQMLPNSWLHVVSFQIRQVQLSL